MFYKKENSVFRKFTLLSCFVVSAVSTAVNAEILETFSSDANDYNFNISPAFDRAVFATAKDNFEQGKIWQVLRLKNGTYAQAEQLNLGPSQYKYSDPMLVKDGKTLLFISDRPLHDKDVANDYNIWQASLVEGEWQNIKALPSSVNSEHDELGPELHNGVLYFASGIKGQLAVYQAKPQGLTYKTREFSPLANSKLSRSDITFSPNGNIALFWQLSEDKTDTELMMMRKKSGRWSEPKKAHASIQSPRYEFTPQFSPDGQWLFFSSAKINERYKGLNIHKVPTQDVFPTDWYDKELGHVNLDVIAPKKILNQINSISYAMRLFRHGDAETERHFIQFSPFEYCKRDHQQYSWTNGEMGIAESKTGSILLNDQQVTQLTRSAKYNFIHMLKQAQTKIYRQYSSQSEYGQVYRLHVPELEPFSIKLDVSLSQIKQLRYDDGAIGLESDYKELQQVQWPMKFGFVLNNKLAAEGEFFDVKFNLTNQCSTLKTEVKTQQWSNSATKLP